MTETSPAKTRAELAPAVCFVGKSETGKTTLLEKLIPELKRQGIRIGTVKHHAHPGFEIDQPGKDTWRHAQAGSEHVVLIAPDKVASIRILPREPSLEEILSEMHDLDLVLVEGFKRSSLPKIEIVRMARSPEAICAAHEVIAFVTDGPLPFSVPTFGLEDIPQLANFLIRHFGLRPTPDRDSCDSPTDGQHHYPEPSPA